MRCPKCGFVSFDFIESCVKCGKNISTAVEELHGTVAGVAPPTFLKVVDAEATSEAPEETAVDTGEPLDLGAEGGEEAVDFSFDEEPPPEAEAEEVELDLGEGDGAAGEMPEIDLGGEEGPPEIDLGLDEEVAFEPEAAGEDVMDISDLSPAEEAESILPPEEPLEEEPELVGEETEALGGGTGLEDLKVDGIDLDSTPGASDSDKVMPSVKTGTALDDFDIDLGDLLTSKKD